MEIDDRKFAAIIKHFGVPIESDPGSYQLEIPLAEWLAVPQNQKVLAADMPSWHSGKPSTVCYVTFTPAAPNESPGTARR